MSRGDPRVRLSFVVATESGEIAEVLAHSERADLRDVVSEIETLAEAVQRSRPDALLVDLGPDPSEVLRHVERLRPPRPLLIVYGPDDSALLRRAMQLGAREYLTHGADAKDELLEALERLVRERQRGDAPTASAPMLAVMGAKGGVGATFVACQLAAGLAHRGSRVALADMKLRLGDAALYFDLQPQYTVSSLAGAAGRIDAAFLQTVLATHPGSGVRVLAAPERPEEADAVALEQTDHALGILREEFDWVVVDVAPDFDDRSVHTLDRASHILIVTTSDVPALNHARLQLGLLKRLGHPPTKVRVVVNRMDGRAAVQAREIDQFLHRKCDALLPNDYPTASLCVNEGRPLWEAAPKSALRAAFDELAEATHVWCGVPLPDGDAKKARGLRGLLRRRRHGAA
jgi:pilus assembly protein CpaE